MNSQTFFKLWAVFENMFPVQVSDKVHRGWTDGQFFDLTPIKMLQITSQRLTWSYEKMVAKHFDYLPIEVLFTEQSYPRETSFFPSGARNMQIGYLLANFTRLFGATTTPSPSNNGPDDDIILNNHKRCLNACM